MSVSRTGSRLAWIVWQVAQRTWFTSWALPDQLSCRPPRWQARQASFWGSTGAPSPKAMGTGEPAGSEMWAALAPWQDWHSWADPIGVRSSALTPWAVARMERTGVSEL